MFIASMLLMTATRFHHVSDWLHLPDASMAVFFLGGLALRRHGYFIALLGLSVAIDWTAVRLAGVSDFCITAAYAALPVAYGVLWYAGRATHARLRPSAASLSIAWGLGTLAAVLSFLISNGAFYWWGGRYTDPHWAQYLQRAWQWGPLFVRTTALYLAVVLAAAWCALRWRAATPFSTPSEVS
ncbi:membrane protein [Xanthomonas citri pv. glycines str. 8ra]|nr:membrane protein [Xanthomonas citri pv. glycines str. 8ra]